MFAQTEQLICQRDQVFSMVSTIVVLSSEITFVLPKVGKTGGKMDYFCVLVLCKYITQIAILWYGALFFQNFRNFKRIFAKVYMAKKSLVKLLRSNLMSISFMVSRIGSFQLKW